MGHTQEWLDGFEADGRGVIAENIIPNKEQEVSASLEQAFPMGGRSRRAIKMLAISCRRYRGCSWSKTGGKTGGKPGKTGAKPGLRDRGDRPGLLAGSLPGFPRFHPVSPGF